MEAPLIEKAPSPKGDITLITLTSDTGMQVRLSSLGAGINAILVPDGEGHLVDVALGYAHPADYLYDGPCMGKTPGRHANRLAQGRLQLEETVWQMPINNGPNHLHGGPEGFQNQLWNVAHLAPTEATFTLFSPDGDMNYPGNLVASATYRLEGNRLSIAYHAQCDRLTACNLTNHTYFNLDGHGSGSVLDHELWLAYPDYCPTDETLIPCTPCPTPVEGTPMDFRTPKPLGRDIEADFPALRFGKGYDSFWCSNAQQVKGPVARLRGVKSGIQLEVETDQYGVQVYTGNWLGGCPEGKEGAQYEDYAGVAIECADMPNGPNATAMGPHGVLTPQRTYQKHIYFTFSSSARG